MTTAQWHAGHIGDGYRRREVVFDANHGHVATMLDRGAAGIQTAIMMAAAPTMYATLQWVLAGMTNINAIDQSELAQRVINALRDAGMKPDDLDAAAIALLKGCARA